MNYKVVKLKASGKKLLLNRPSLVIIVIYGFYQFIHSSLTPPILISKYAPDLEYNLNFRGK